MNITNNASPKATLSDDERDCILKSVLSEIKKVVTSQQFDIWFSNIKLSSITGKNMIFTVPNNFIREWLTNNYTDLFSDSVYRILNTSHEIIFVTENGHERNSKDEEIPDLSNVGDKESVEKYYPIPLEYYSFENFVVGSCNRLAHAAALAVSESPGCAYNPLFIHGPSGLGKTHLLHAINNAISSKHSTKVLYLSCERFVNHYISTIRSNNWTSFRKLYRNVDVLLMDDIQFFKDSQGCKEEFFHTFNALYNARKQIVITSDCPPDSIDSLEDRLISRFKWGLLCSIEAPNRETLTAIIEKKTQLCNLQLTQESVSFLTENPPDNMREIEGLIIRLNKESKSLNGLITPEIVKKVMRDVTGCKKTVHIESVLKAVSQRFNISVAHIQSKNRTKSLILPRQVAMYISRRLTNLSLAEIGGYMGGRDHSTIIHADEKIINTIKKDKNLYLLVKKIENDLLK